MLDHEKERNPITGSKNPTGNVYARNAGVAAESAANSFASLKLFLQQWSIFLLFMKIQHISERKGAHRCPALEVVAIFAFKEGLA